MDKVQLIGKVLVKADIRTITGFRVGGAQAGLKVGGLDAGVITDAEGRPYIPGSSLRGKLLTLAERHAGKKPGPNGGRHQCTLGTPCDICKVWGVGGGKDSNGLTGLTLGRLIVRDTLLDETTITEEMKRHLDLQFTEVKWETAIDRRTGTALDGSLRQIERVPAGAAFKPAELVFNVYEESDKDLLRCLFVAMELLEDDYLGGMGSRGYGKVKFENIGVWWNTARDYEDGTVALDGDSRRINDGMKTPQELVNGFSKLRAQLDRQTPQPPAEGDPSPCSG